MITKENGNLIARIEFFDPEELRLTINALIFFASSWSEDLGNGIHTDLFYILNLLRELQPCEDDFEKIYKHL